MARSFGTYDPVVRGFAEKGLFAEVSPGARDRLLTNAFVVEVPAGSILYREYEPARVGIVLQGLLRTCISSREGKRITLRYNSPGELIGMPAVVGGPIAVSVEAVRPSAALALDPGVIEELGKTEAGLGWRIAEEVGADLCDLVISLTENAFDSIQVRIARHLIHLAVSGAKGEPPRAAITQRELADSVGSVREVVLRNLHRLRDDGLIELEPDGIAILDIPGLKAISRRQ